MLGYGGHQLNHLVGPHVRVTVYDMHELGAAQKYRGLALSVHEVSLISSFGLLGSNVHTLVRARFFLCSLYGDQVLYRQDLMEHLASKTGSSGHPSSGFLELRTVTVSSCRVQAKFFVYSNVRSMALVNVHFNSWTLTADMGTISDEDWDRHDGVFFQKIFWPFSQDQTDWVAKYARFLPKGDHTWMKAISRICDSGEVNHE